MANERGRVDDIVVEECNVKVFNKRNVWKD